MPLLITFSALADAFESIPLRKSKPFVFTSGDLTLEIAWENGQYFVACNQEIQINFAKRYFAPLESDDLICFQNRFIIFKTDPADSANKLFVCNYLKNGKNTFLFKLPEKIDRPLFSCIFKMAADHRTVKQLYIDCRATLFMNSQAVEDMLTLAKKLKERRIAVCFYEPNQKFISYLKLANIEKLIPVKYSNGGPFDHTIKALRASVYVITQKGDQYIIQPGQVRCVGRTRSCSHICLNDRRVSRTHALIVNISDKLYVIDCCSGNYTFINEEKIVPLSLYQLFAEDTVSFGGDDHFRIEQKAPWRALADSTFGVPHG